MIAFGAARDRALLRALDQAEVSLHKQVTSMKKWSLDGVRNTEHPLTPAIIRFLDELGKQHRTREELFRRLFICKEYIRTAPARAHEYFAAIVQRKSIFLLNADPLTLAGLYHPALTKVAVHVLDMGPGSEGRESARVLSERGFVVHIYTPWLLREALRNVDMVVVGDVLLSSHGIVVPLGTSLISEQLRFLHKSIPLVGTSLAWTYHETTRAQQMEEESPWSLPEGVVPHYKTQELIAARLMTTIVTDIGVLSGQFLGKEVRKQYPWL